MGASVPSRNRAAPSPMQHSTLLGPRRAQQKADLLPPLPFLLSAVTYVTSLCTGGSVTLAHLGEAEAGRRHGQGRRREARAPRGCRLRAVPREGGVIAAGTASSTPSRACSAGRATSAFSARGRQAVTHSGLTNLKVSCLCCEEEGSVNLKNQAREILYCVLDFSSAGRRLCLCL